VASLFAIISVFASISAKRNTEGSLAKEELLVELEARPVIITQACEYVSSFTTLS
jgi:hypothetical protein